MNIQSKQDKIQANLIAKLMPEVIEIYPDILSTWHKYCRFHSTLTDEDMTIRYNEMHTLLDFFTEWAYRFFKDLKFEKISSHRQSLNNEEMPIIMYWHQGFENATECTKMCVNSFINNQKRKVILLDYNSIQKLVKVDARIKELFEANKIEYAIYSDYLRMLLLEKYRCVWVDATMFCVKDIDERLIYQEYWSVKGNWLSGHASRVKGLTYHCHFGQIYMLGGTSNYIFSKVRQMMEYYYSKHDTNFCYFMHYVFFEYLYRYDNKARKQIDACPNNNTHVEYLTCMRDVAYSQTLENEILSEDTSMYKLSNRIEYDYNTSSMLATFCKKFS